MNFNIELGSFSVFFARLIEHSSNRFRVALQTQSLKFLALLARCQDGSYKKVAILYRMATYIILIFTATSLRFPQR